MVSSHEQSASRTTSSIQSDINEIKQLIVVRPGFTEVHPAFAYSFGAMLAYAIFMLLTRKLSTFDPPLVTLFYAMLVGVIGGAPIALAHWVWPEGALQWLQLLSLGAFGGLGHFIFIHAYRLAPASAVTKRSSSR